MVAMRCSGSSGRRPVNFGNLLLYDSELEVAAQHLKKKVLCHTVIDGEFAHYYLICYNATLDTFEFPQPPEKESELSPG